MKTKDSYTIQRVWSTAREWLLTKGLTGWNMTQFAEACGMTKRTLYKMISGKEALAEGVLLAEMAAAQQDLARIAEDSPGFREGLGRMVRFFPERIAPLQQGPVQEILREYPRLEETMKERRKELTGDLERFLQGGMGHLRDGLDTAVVLESLQAITLFYTRKKTEPLLRRKDLETALGYLIHGILKEAVDEGV